MRIPLLLTLIFLFGTFAIHAQSRLKLSDAIAKGFVKLKITGNGGHTGRCATVQTENTTSQVLDVDIDCGQKIQCSDSTAQNLIITQTEHVRLTPKRIVSTVVFAMCINAAKSSPGNKIGFKLGQMAQGALLRLSKFIEKKKYQNSHAQGAVWTLTDNKEIASIGDNETEDYQMVNELRGFVATEKHITNFPKAKPHVRKLKEVEGTMDIILQSKANVEVVMLDDHSKAVNQLMKSQKEAGILRINYSVKNTDYKPGSYFIIVRVAGKEVKRELIHLE